MLRTIQIAPGFGGGSGTRQAAQATTRWLAQAATALRMIGETWDESVAAHHRYGQLTSRHVPHATAIREALGFGPAPAHERAERTKPLGFAGRA
jgi:hypothetical protein